jgi:poly-beta-1,6-N-acetyl-D-glucosamine synthase
MGTSAARLVVVTPARNEAEHIARLAESIERQTRRPDLWAVVDDDSSDSTLERLAPYASSLPFLRLFDAPPATSVNGARDRLAMAAEAVAFNRALRALGPVEFTHIAKLDGDVELPPDYFERVLRAFAESPGLGIAGGAISELTAGEWRVTRAPEYHVHGAVKTYSRACFDAIGGIHERLGWDTIDQTYARMRGFETRLLDDLVVRHHRPSGAAQGVLRGRARHGRCAYVARYGLLWTTLRAGAIALDRPRGIGGAAFLGGYLAAALMRQAKVDDPEFRAFVRRELRERLIGALRACG